MALWNEYLGFTKFPPFEIFLVVKSKISVVWWRVPSSIPTGHNYFFTSQLGTSRPTFPEGGLWMLYASELLAWKLFWASACTFWRGILTKPFRPNLMCSCARVHFSFDVLPSWAKQGSCAHKCVCWNFITVTRNAVNKSVWRKEDCSWLPLNKPAMNIW